MDEARHPGPALKHARLLAAKGKVVAAHAEGSTVLMFHAIRAMVTKKVIQLHEAPSNVLAYKPSQKTTKKNISSLAIGKLLFLFGLAYHTCFLM